jgi:predicted CXXCH cytochrome family protein
MRLAVGLLLGAVGVAGAQVVPGAGECGICHQDAALAYTYPGGHAPALDCVACHKDLRPGQVGRRHRARPVCGSCHANQVVGHPEKAASRTGRKQTHNCLGCHEPHGTTNLSLIAPLVRSRGKLYDVVFTNDAGLAPDSFASPTDPGHGLCETCHRKTDVYPRSGNGAPHFTQTCTLCHDHAAAFAPVASPATCNICHAAEAARLAMPSGHSGRACESCHAPISPTPGPGHQSAEACQTCHPANQTHAPGGAAMPCTQCHDPHGSTNVDLVREEITTSQGGARLVTFDNIEGRADGSFASASDPGSGICEICHTTTQFYRADGTGAPHFTFSCLPCHTHAAGFEP